MHVVTNADDLGPGSLRQAIADAASGDEIIFSAELVGQTISLSSGQLVIDKNLAITGPGSDSLSISGSHSSRIFDVQAGISATISGLTVSEGVGGSNGGGIWTGPGAFLTINHVVIKGNSATDNGGGLYNSSGATAKIMNSTISGNEVLGDLSPNGGGLYNAGGVVLIEESVISDNKATRGGGIWNTGAGKMEIHRTAVTENVATSEGGGIYNNNKLSITSSTISGNEAVLEGGGIKSRGSDTLDIVNSTISGNKSDRAGGLLNETFGTAVIRNSTIYRNQSVLPGAGIGNDETAKIFIYSTIVASNIENGSVHSDMLDLGSIASNGFNFIGNGDARDDVVGSNRFDRLLTDFVGFNVFPLDPFLGPLVGHEDAIKAHIPLAGSPVIDNGDCQMTGSDFDQFGAPRVVDVAGPAFGNAGDGCDIGAVEATRSIALPREDVPEAITRKHVLEPAFPNPFTDQATFKVTLTREQKVTVTLHNLMGQLVRTIHAGVLLPNTVYTFEIDADNLGSGLYLYSISSRAFAESRTILLIK